MNRSYRRFFETLLSIAVSAHRKWLTHKTQFTNILWLEQHPYYCHLCLTVDVCVHACGCVCELCDAIRWFPYLRQKHFPCTSLAIIDAEYSASFCSFRLWYLHCVFLIALISRDDWLTVEPTVTHINICFVFSLFFLSVHSRNFWLAQSIIILSSAASTTRNFLFGFYFS